MSIAIEIKDEIVRRLIGQLAERMEDLSEPMNAIGVYIVKRARERFEKSGPGWPPLSPRTVAKRRKGSSKPLIDTGRLMASIGNVAKEGVFQVTERSVRVGTNVIYAAIQNFGGRAGRGHSVEIPARPFLYVEDRDVDVFKEIILRYLEGQGE